MQFVFNFLASSFVLQYSCHKMLNNFSPANCIIWYQDLLSHFQNITNSPERIYKIFAICRWRLQQEFSSWFWAQVTRYSGKEKEGGQGKAGCRRGKETQRGWRGTKTACGRDSSSCESRWKLVMFRLFSQPSLWTWLISCN